MKYYIKIKHLIFCFRTKKPIVFPASFIPFLIEGSPEAHVSIEILYDANYTLANATPLQEQRTHHWYSLPTGEIVLMFSRRADNQMEDPWFLVMKNDYDWKLYLRSASANELFDRPWLQRAFCNRIKNDDMYVSHGGCCIFDGCGVLILGECGQGKSTLVELLSARGAVPLSDDRILLSAEGNRLRCYSTPWNLKHPEYVRAGSTLVDQILFLEHAVDNRNALSKVDSAEVAKKIVSQFYLPLPVNLAKAYAHAMRFILKYRLPAYTFHFTPDQSAVNHLEECL